MAIEPQGAEPQGREQGADLGTQPAESSAAPRGGAALQFHAIGRRKTAVARVFLRPGKGQWKVNGRTLDDYFPRPVLRQSVAQPLVSTDTQGQYDVLVNVEGGGLRGQAEAVRLGIARALLKVDDDFRRRLRADALLTRDPREVERKKPGRPKARKRFQFSKR
jgi:small subunit ribosomal protein S9